jgi:hypothetical protein
MNSTGQFLNPGLPRCEQVLFSLANLPRNRAIERPKKAALGQGRQLKNWRLRGIFSPMRGSYGFSSPLGQVQLRSG